VTSGRRASSISAETVVSTSLVSYETGRDLARQLVERLGGELAVALFYATANHNQRELVRGVRDGAPKSVPVLGCSTQGIISRGGVDEDGYAAGAIGFAGPIRAGTGCVHNIEQDSRAKGEALGRELLLQLNGQPPRVVILHYDPMVGADIDQLTAGLHDIVRCRVIGGAAGQTWGPMSRTVQYFADGAFEHAAVAVALAGDFHVETATCHGTVPIGIEMTVTRADGNKLLELDGRSALAIWREIAGIGVASPHIEHTAALAIGIRAPATEAEGLYLVRDAFGADDERGGVVLQAGISVGTKIMLHHRSVTGVVNGTAAMAADLKQRLVGRTVRAVLGFECGARTKPFLGHDQTVHENALLLAAFEPDVPFLSMIAWGEIYPLGGKPEFFNYTYPVLVLAD
jgi:hypothetical protein